MSTKNTKEKLPEQTNTSEDKKPNGAPKRQKIVKACKDCRRRKVSYSFIFFFDILIVDDRLNVTEVCPVVPVEDQ